VVSQALELREPHNLCRSWRGVLHQVVEQEAQHRRFRLRSGPPLPPREPERRERGPRDPDEGDKSDPEDEEEQRPAQGCASSSLLRAALASSRLARSKTKSGAAEPTAQDALVAGGTEPEELQGQESCPPSDRWTRAARVSMVVSRLAGSTDEPPRETLPAASGAVNHRRSGLWGRAEKRATAVDRLGAAGPRASLHPQQGHAEPGSSRADPREKLWRRVFGRLAKGQRVMREDLRQAADQAGLASARQADLDAAFESVSMFSSLGQEEFFRFMDLFERRYRERVREAFERADADRSGFVSMDELRGVMIDVFGQLPSTQLLHELMQETDSDGSGQLDLQEFEGLIRLLRESVGFTREERQALQELFQRFDPDGTGSVGSEHVPRALAWQGSFLDAEEVAALAAEVDADGSGGLDFHEWLMCHRKARDMERQRFREAFEALDADGSGTIPVDRVTDLLYLLGCMADHGTVLEIAEEVCSPREPRLGAEDVEELLRQYLVRDGLSQEVCAAVKAAMERYDPGGDGFLGSEAVGKLLRWFGHSLASEDVLRLVGGLDLDVPGQLRERDVRRLLRRVQESGLQRMHAAFEAQDGARSGRITGAQARDALLGMQLLQGTEACPGSELPEVIQAIPSAKCEDGLTRTAFVYVASQHAARARESFRENAGYSANELVELRHAFQNYDADGNGLISNSELVALVRGMFPVVNTRIKRRLGELMQEVAGQRSGEMDFPDFVRLMRQFHDLLVQEMAEKEKCAVADTQFSAEEVAGFRGLFLETSRDGPGPKAQVAGAEELPLQSLMRLVGNICSVSQSTEKTILKYIMDAKARCEARGAVVRRPGVAADGSFAVMVDFAEFLRVMRQLLEANFGNVVGGRTI
ncbi:unnamed protein product, partial [Prorocentrum cordatum]